MKREQFGSLMALLFAAYDKEAREDTIEVWYQFLGGFEFETLRNVITTAIQTEKFFPAIATLKMLVVDRLAPVPSEADVMNDLWGSIGGYGIYRSPHFEFPVTHALVEEIGWRTICNMSEDKVVETIHFRYKPVAKHYERCVLKGLDFPINPIKGIFALQNGPTGRLTEKVSTLGEALEGIVAETLD